jgi:SAM-dependent methyltransferase
MPEDYGEGLQFGDKHYRAWVGPPRYYDRIGALQFVALTLLGMREDHSLLDVGCGSLRGGRLAIVYLRPGRYFGIEPAEWALEDGKRANLGDELIQIKCPTFQIDDQFSFTRFGQQFDYILVHSVFSHCAPSQISRCLNEAHRVMQPASILVATYLEADDDYAGEAGPYPGVARYTRRFIADRLSEAGLECIHLDWPHPYDQRWFVGVLPGNAKDFSAMTNGSEFSYTQYLAEELEARTGKPTPSHTDFLLDALRATGWGT